MGQRSHDFYKKWIFFAVFCFGLAFLIVDSVVGVYFPFQSWSSRFHMIAHFTILLCFVAYAVFAAWALRGHRRSEKARVETAERFRLLFEHSPHGIFLIETREDSVDWPILDCNPAACLMNGYSREELIGNSVEVLHPEISVPEERKRFLHTAREKRVMVYETSHRRKDGTYFSVEVQTCLLDLNGKEVLLGFDSDITERKRFEAALRESEEKYKALFDHSVDGILLVDIQNEECWTIVDCNETACRMNGYAREELIGMELQKLNTEKGDMSQKSGLLSDLRQGRNKVYQDVHRQKDGTLIPIEFKASLIVIDGKEYLLGLDRDISAKKQAEEELRASEEKYRTVVENVEEAIFILEETGKVLFVNRYGQDLLGVSDERLWLQDYFEVAATRDGKDIFQQALQSRGYTGEVMSKIRGVPHWFRINIQPIGGTGGTPRVALCMAMDITEQKNHEQELHSEKERLDVILRSVGEGVIATDLEGRVMFLNDTAERLTGWSQNEAVGRLLPEVYRTLVDKESKGKGRISDIANETVLSDREGKERLISENGAVIRDAGDQIVGMVVTFRDVTEEKRMEEDLLKTQKLESLGYLAGGIAHDFNNILAALLTKIQLTQALYDRERDVSSHFKDMEKAVGRAGALTHQLLTFSKGGKPIKKSVKLTGIIQETVGFALNGARVVSEYIMDPDLWPAEVDEGQISQALNNLVINAEQAMPDGGTIRIHAQNVVVKSEDALPLEPGKYVRISVEDHGIGIPAEHLHKIYDPYFTTKQRGSGLGLTTTFSIIKRHDGYINVDSTYGVGTTFHIYLPVSETAPQTMESPFLIPGGTGRILLLDDDADLLITLTEVLTHWGYTVEGFRDGREVLERYCEALEQKMPFDLTILDLTVPAGMGGKETMAKLMQVDPAVKAIVMSGYSNDPVLADYRAYGFCGMAVKPFKIQELYCLIDKVISENKTKEMQNS